MKVQLFLIIVFFQFCSILNVNEENYIIGNFEINQTVSPVTIICNFFKKEEIDIFVNGERIEFNNRYKFPTVGNYVITYKFKVYLNDMDRLFCECNFISIFGFISLLFIKCKKYG